MWESILSLLTAAGCDRVSLSHGRVIYNDKRAGMAELVDARDLKSLDDLVVRVRLPLPVLIFRESLYNDSVVSG